MILTELLSVETTHLKRIQTIIFQFSPYQWYYSHLSRHAFFQGCAPFRIELIIGYHLNSVPEFELRYQTWCRIII